MKAFIQITIPVDFGDDENADQRLRNLQGERQTILNALVDWKSMLDVDFSQSDIRVVIDAIASGNVQWGGGPGQPYGT